MIKFKWVAIAILAIIIAVGGGWVYLVKFEQEKPTIQLLPDKKYLGQNLTVIVEDQKSGVAEVQIEVTQQGKAMSFLSEKFPPQTHRVEKTLTLRPLPKDLKEGEAQIKISAKDHSWNWGNPVSLEKSVVIDTTPPQLSVLGTLHYGNQGGAALITYQISEEAPMTGVQVGEVFFPGYGISKDRYLAYFAIPADASSDSSFSALAEDHAGNRTKAGFREIVKPKAFQKDKIQLTDQFLNKFLPYFTARDPNLKGSPLEIFLALNRKQRELDHQEIKKLCKETSLRPLWSGRFLRLPNAQPMASFAQNRTYYYDGQAVDRQIHWGWTWPPWTRARCRQPTPGSSCWRAQSAYMAIRF